MQKMDIKLTKIFQARAQKINAVAESGDSAQPMGTAC